MSAGAPDGAHVRFSGWGWRYAGRDAWSLRGLDLEIGPGERVLLLGPSGAGKSTLLHALAGLTGPDAAVTGESEGELLVDGAPVRRGRGAVGLVGQDPQAQLVMARAGDDAAFGPENLGVPPEEIGPRAAGALEAVGFPYGWDRPTAALSGGEQQRLAIAGALAMRPRLLLLDEPTANLDPAGAELVRGVVAGLAARSGATLVLVEHRVAEAVGLVDRVVVLEPGGGVAADGPPERVFAERGAELAARGVWVPGREPQAPAGGGAPGEVLIEARDLRALEPRGPGVPARGRRTVLDGVGAAVRGAAVTALTGANGSGKSTLLGLLGGLARPDGGTVRPAGALAAADRRDLGRWPARLLARRVGTVFQHAEDQFVTGTVRDELEFAPLRAGLGRRRAQAWAAELMGRLRLEDLAGAHPFTLSGGEQRRLSVATALSSGPEHAPDVLLLDEPTFGQDAVTWAEVAHLLDALRAEGRAVVAATHDERLLDSFADTELRLPPSPTTPPQPATPGV